MQNHRSKIKVINKFVLGITTVFLLAISLRWLYVFTFTDYRAHHRPIIIPLALMFFVAAIRLIVKIIRN